MVLKIVRATEKTISFKEYIVSEAFMNFRSFSFDAFLLSFLTCWSSKRENQPSLPREMITICLYNMAILFPAFSFNFQRETPAKTGIR